MTAPAALMDPESALLTAVQEFLTTDGGYGQEECSVQWDGRPVPTAGQRYIVVAPGGWDSAGQEQQSLGYIISFVVKVYIRLPVAPSDADNVLKFYMDAMNEIVYEDDKIVCPQAVERLWSENSTVIIRCWFG